MLEFIAGLGAGTVAWMAMSFTLASRKDRRAREQMRRFAEMQEAIFDVQDAVADAVMSPPPNEVYRQTEIRDLEELRAVRNRAATRYFAAL